MIMICKVLCFSSIRCYPFSFTEITMIETTIWLACRLWPTWPTHFIAEKFSGWNFKRLRWWILSSSKLRCSQVEVLRIPTPAATVPICQLWQLTRTCQIKSFHHFCVVCLFMDATWCCFPLCLNDRNPSPFHYFLWKKRNCCIMHPAFWNLLSILATLLNVRNNLPMWNLNGWCEWGPFEIIGFDRVLLPLASWHFLGLFKLDTGIFCCIMFPWFCQS